MTDDTDVAVIVDQEIKGAKCGRLTKVGERRGLGAGLVDWRIVR